MKNNIKNTILKQSENLNAIANTDYIDSVEKAVEIQIKALKSNHKILIAGNGGSAADAQHFAAELVGRFIKERKGYAAIALTTDTSILTSVANDYAYNQVFSRQIEALGQEGDVFIGLSTSGNSENIIEAVKLAKQQGLTTIGMLGKDGGKLASLCDVSMVVPFEVTARVQETHGLTVHIMCELVEEALYNMDK